jgi:polar amino acid transport system substrate-binding protein
VAPSAAPSTATGGTLARIKADKTMRLGFTNEAPWGFANADGTLSGIEPVIAAAFAKSLGVENTEGVLAPFPAMIPGLLANRYDAITAGMFIRPQRCTQIAFGDPHVATTQGIIVEAGNPLGIKSYADLASNPKVTITVLPGGSELALAKVAGVPEDRMVFVQDVASQFAALKAKRANAVLTPTLSGASYLLANPDPSVERLVLDPQPIDETGKPFAGFPGLGFRQEDKDLLDAYNAWLTQAKASGELLTLLAPFGITPDQIAPSVPGGRSGITR